MHQTISSAQVIGRYAGHPALSDAVRTHVTQTCYVVNVICTLAEHAGVLLENDPDTGTSISGIKDGVGGGGWTPPEIARGASNSPHYDGNAIDRFDPKRQLMRWCLKNVQKLVDLGVYMEHPQWTSVWCHFQRVPPRSHSRWYVPYSDLNKFPTTCKALPEQEAAGVRIFRYIPLGGLK